MRSDMYLEAMKELGVAVKVAEEQKITLFDGVFDGKDPEKYARRSRSTVWRRCRLEEKLEVLA